MSDNKYKVNIDYLLYNGTYFFTYNVKTIEPGQFSDPKMFHINNFQVCTSVAMEVQLQSWNFKPKEVNKVTCGYSFKPLNLYYIENI